MSVLSVVIVNIFFFTPTDGFELVTESFARNLPHCAAVLACLFCLLTMAIIEDAVCVYLYGDVKVALEGKGFGCKVSMKNETPLKKEAKHFLRSQQKSHGGLYICQLICVKQTWEAEVGLTLILQLSALHC